MQTAVLHVSLKAFVFSDYSQWVCWMLWRKTHQQHLSARKGIHNWKYTWQQIHHWTKCKVHVWNNEFHLPSVSLWEFPLWFICIFWLNLRIPPSHLEAIGDLPSEELFIFWKYGTFQGSCKILIYPLTLILSLVGTPIQTGCCFWWFISASMTTV